MRRSTAILSLTTAVFCASTLYLALKLYGVGAEPAAESGAIESTHGVAQSAVGAAGLSAAHDPMATATALAQATSSSTAAPAPASGDAEAAANADTFFMKQQLAKLKDPVQRAAVLADSNAGLRRQFSQFRDKFELSDATFGQLVTLMAEETLQAQEKYMTCAVNPRCNTDEFNKRNPVDDHSQELLALLGADQLDEFTRFRSSIGEREMVVQLKGRLTEGNALRDEQADSLARALTDERERFQKDAAARGATLNGWGTNLGMIMYSNDSNSIDQRLAEAAQYSQRMRERAGGLLTPAQLAAFNQMQDELLAQMAAFMRPASNKAGRV